MTRRCFLGNFEFEHTLADRTYSAEITERLREINQALAYSWLAMIDENDVLLAPEEVDPWFLSHLREREFPEFQVITSPEQIPADCELVPWGWTESLADLARELQPGTAIPPMEAVRTVNSRRFSYALEKEWGLAPEGVMLLEEVEHLDTTIPCLPDADRGWVLKAEFSMSARERMLSEGTTISDEMRNWVRKRIEKGNAVFLEPWLPAKEEAGIQIQIDPDGTCELKGIAPLLTNEYGQYAGSRIGCFPEENWDDALEFAMRAAERAAEVGYFGPLGIDVMRYEDDGEIKLRAIQDINARWTMGRLALNWERWIAPDYVGSWRHFRWVCPDAETNQDWWNLITPSLPKGVKVLRTSPFTINDELSPLASVLISAPSREALLEAEQVFA